MSWTAQDFFINHLYEEVKDKYGLTDAELDSVLELMPEFNMSDIKKALIHMKMHSDPAALREILQHRSPTELVREPATPSNLLSMPMGSQ